MKLLLSYNVNELIRAIHKDKRRSTKEWSWLCKAELINGDYHVTDIFFPTQKNQTAYTEFTKEPLDELASYLFKKDWNLDSYGKYCVWLHSHQKMSAFWSGTDYNTRKSFKDRWSEGFISLVTSQTSGSSNCRWVFYHATLDVYSPVEFDIDIDVEVWLPCTQLEERETEEYLEHLESLKKFEESIENLKNNMEVVKNNYWLTDEQIEKIIDTAPPVFRWSQTKTFYTEPESIRLNKDEKIQELYEAEEVTYTYQSQSTLWRRVNWVWFANNEEDKNDRKNNKKKEKGGSVNSSLRWDDRREWYDERDDKYKDLLSK